uniref:TROVE domain-containing protein n=1 Tax=Magallana gigas TaxID=29159 RepID=A0A8W8IDA9_MAGGI|nr:60 kDa SS-A/Ro ribonucleoprotein [Crassostrea gigas]
MELMEIDSEQGGAKSWPEPGVPIEEGPEKSTKEPLTSKQVQNELGGYVFEVTDKIRLRRFLCLGTERTIFHTGEVTLTLENDICNCITRLISKDGTNVVKTIRKFSVENRACKSDYVLFALALCCRCTDLETKEAAYKALSDVCRIPTHLFKFIKFSQEVNSKGKGWGRAHRKGVSMWYHSYKNKEGGIPLLAYHMTKYKARFGFTHKDVFRLCHIKTGYGALGYLVHHFYRGNGHREDDWQNKFNIARQHMTKHDKLELKNVIDFLQDVDDAKKCSDEQQMKGIIVLRDDLKIVREHVPTSLLKSKEVWDGLMRFMPMNAMLRNLGRMSSFGLLEFDSLGEDLTTNKLKNTELLKEARIHPFTLLIAEKAFSKGHNKKGNLQWKVNPKVRDALRDAFHLSFKNVEATGKRFQLAICMSGTENPHVNGTPIITATEAAAAMALVTCRSEKNCDIVAFSGIQSTEHPNITNCSISPEDDLDAVLDKCSKLPCDKTNIAAPIIHAFENKKMYDVFVVFTDSVNEDGSVHPSRALELYRKGSGITDARLIVCGLASNEFSIADPDDPLMMDIVGFDSNAPTAIHQFVTGNI